MRACIMFARFFTEISLGSRPRNPGMETRIGYPNEHLAKGADETKSPLYATGVGLVIKGLQDFEKRKRNEKEPADEHPRHKGNWFKHFFTDAKKIFTDDSDDKII